MKSQSLPVIADGKRITGISTPRQMVPGVVIAHPMARGYFHIDLKRYDPHGAAHDSCAGLNVGYAPTIRPK